MHSHSESSKMCLFNFVAFFCCQLLVQFCCCVVDVVIISVFYNFVSHSYKLLIALNMYTHTNRARKRKTRDREREKENGLYAYRFMHDLCFMCIRICIVWDELYLFFRSCLSIHIDLVFYSKRKSVEEQHEHTFMHYYPVRCWNMLLIFFNDPTK